MEVIFKTVVGSKLYGLETEDSDTDYKGVFMPDANRIIPDENNYFGLNPLKPHTIVEGHNGKHGTEKEEWVLYSAQHFMNLFTKGNPTLAEIPFAKESAIIEQHPCSEEYMQFIRDNMITQHLFKGYYGFFNDQIKSFIRGKGKSREKRLRKNCILPKGYNIPLQIEKDFLEIGLSDDISIPNSKKQESIMSMREYLISAGWYDGKMMSHAYRIGVQGVQLFRDGHIEPTMSGESLDIALRMKKFGDINNHPDRITRNKSIDIVKQLGCDMQEANGKSHLPVDVDREHVNDFLVEFHKRWYNCG